MAIVRQRFAHTPQVDLVQAGRGQAGHVFGFGRVGVMRGGLGRTADQVGQSLYPKYTGEWVYAYQGLFPSLDIGSLPPGGTFAGLVAQGVLTRDEVIQGFGVSETFAAANPSNIDNGIMKTNYDAIGPVDQTSFQDFLNGASAPQPAPAAPAGPVVKLVNGQNVDGNGMPYPPGSPHYYNQLADMIDQYLAAGGTKGVATVAMQALVKSNPGLVDTLPPDLLTAYSEVFDTVLNPPPASGGTTAGASSGSSSSGSSSSGSTNVGGGTTTGDMPQPTPPDTAGTVPPTAALSLAGIPGGVWGLVAVAALGLAVLTSKPSKRG